MKSKYEVHLRRKALSDWDAEPRIRYGFQLAQAANWLRTRQKVIYLCTKAKDEIDEVALVYLDWHLLISCAEAVTETIKQMNALHSGIDVRTCLSTGSVDGLAKWKTYSNGNSPLVKLGNQHIRNKITAHIDPIVFQETISEYTKDKEIVFARANDVSALSLHFTMVDDMGLNYLHKESQITNPSEFYNSLQSEITSVLKELHQFVEALVSELLGPWLKPVKSP